MSEIDITFHVQLFFLGNRVDPYTYTLSERKFHEESKYGEKLDVRVKEGEIWVFKER